MKETAVIREYKVGINAIIVNLCVCENIEFMLDCLFLGIVQDMLPIFVEADEKQREGNTNSLDVCSLADAPVE